MSEIKVNNESLKSPKPYDEKEWLRNAGEADSEKLKNTNYYKFNQAAIKHLKFIKERLANNRIYLDDVPKHRIIKCYLRTKDTNKYVSKVEIDNYPYPTLDTKEKACVLELLLSNDKPLHNGSVVRIRTTENDSELGDYKHLGAWKDCKECYYYTKDFDISKQKWIIEQEDSNCLDNTIDFSKPVRLKNVHFVDDSYLSPYKKYLTTQKSVFEFYIEKVQ